VVVSCAIREGAIHCCFERGRFSLYPFLLKKRSAFNLLPRREGKKPVPPVSYGPVRERKRGRLDLLQMFIKKREETVPTCTLNRRKRAEDRDRARSPLVSEKSGNSPSDDRKKNQTGSNILLEAYVEGRSTLRRGKPGLV